MKKILFIFLAISIALSSSGAKITSTPSGNLTFTETTEWGDELVINFKKCMANNLYTFYTVKLNDKEVNSAQYSDNIGPFMIDGFWAGGNHTNGSEKTANTLSFTISVDGEQYSNAFNTTGSVLTIDVENELIYSDGQKFATECMTYVVSGNSIEVFCEHKYVHPQDLKINRYYGMQSMFLGETEILLPGTDVPTWRKITATGAGNEINITKSSAPDFCTYIEHSANGYQAAYMLREDLGNRDWIANNDVVYIGNSSSKSYHKLIGDHVVKTGDRSSWHGVYTWFSQPITDNCRDEAGDHIFEYGAYIGGIPMVMSLGPDGEMNSKDNTLENTQDWDDYPTGDWKLLGEGEYTEDIFTLVHWQKGEHWKVSVEESVEQPGWYRFVPYGNACPSSIISKTIGEADNDNYMYINASDPHKAYIAKSTFGNKYNVCSYVAENGFDAQKYLKIEDGVITAPDSGIAYKKTEEDKWLLGNFFQNFKLSLPRALKSDEFNYSPSENPQKALSVSGVSSGMQGAMALQIDPVFIESFTEGKIISFSFYTGTEGEKESNSITQATVFITDDLDSEDMLYTKEITVPNTSFSKVNIDIDSPLDIKNYNILYVGVYFTFTSGDNKPFVVDNVTSHSNNFGGWLGIRANTRVKWTWTNISDVGGFFTLGVTIKGDIKSNLPLNYSITDEHQKTAEVAENTNAIGEIIIPSQVEINGETYTVTSIANSAFKNSKITSLTMPSTIKTVGRDAFSYCSQLENVTIGENVESLGDCAFLECKAMTEIEIPNSVKLIDNSCFQNCENLKTVKLGSGVETLGEYSFNACISLTEINMPQSIKTIGKGCFIGCSELTTLEIPKGVTIINQSCFEGCSKLTSIIIPEGVTALDVQCFYRCPALKDVTLPETLISLGNYCFGECASLVSITIPESVKTLGHSCFCDCSVLYSIVLPSTLTSMGNNCFYECSSLAAINIPESLNSLGQLCFYYCKSLTTITIPENISAIGSNCFGGCSSLNEIISLNPTPPQVEAGNCDYEMANKTLKVLENAVSAYQTTNFWKEFGKIEIYDPAIIEFNGLIYRIIDEDAKLAAVAENPEAEGEITIPSEVVVMGQLYTVAEILPSAFEFTKIGSINIANSVKSIGESCFLGCTSLAYVALPEGINLISNNCFRGCTNLSSIIIPESVTTLGENSFHGCIGFTSFTIPNNVTEIGSSCFYGCSKIESIRIPNNITHLSDYCFYECYNLKEITFSENLKSIGEFCFKSCIALENINIPEGLTTIGESCFNNCNALVSVSLPSSLTTIERWAFSECRKLPSIEIPEGVCVIEPYTFHLCDNLKSVVLPSTINKIENDSFNGCYSLVTINLPENVSSIGSTCFKGCHSLPYISIPSSVQSLGDRCFLECKSLQDIELKDGLTTIGEACFYGCIVLKNIVLPKTLISMGANCFWDCNELVAVASLNPIPPQVATSTSDSEMANKTLKVPEGSIAAYQAADFWKEFGRIKVYHEGMELYEFDRAEPESGSAFYETAGMPESIKTYWRDIATEVIIHDDALLYNEAEEIVGEIKLKQSADNFNLIELELGHLSLAAGRYTIAIESGAFGDADEEWINDEVRLTYIIVEAGALMPPTISYNGRYATMSAEEGAEIEYSIDGGDYQSYTDRIDVGGLTTVRAYAKKTEFWDSQVAEYKVLSYGTETRAEIADKGSLAEAYGWADAATINTITNLTVSGFLREADYQWLRERSALTTLDLAGVTVKYGNTIPNRALEGMKLRTVAMPTSINNSGHIGDAIFGGNTDLTAIIWQLENIALPRTAFDGLNNANLLLYVPAAKTSSALSSTINNIIIGGSARSISLTDAAPWGCPIEFTAEEISFNRSFTKQTAIDGGCAGWETIALPFDVDLTSHANGDLLPFAASGSADNRYWLYRPNGAQWQVADRIEANVPYLIAMPNNPAYYEPFNITGEVTFSATNATIPATPANLSYDYRDGYLMTANYRPMADDSKLLVVNDEAVDGNAPGSCFVADQRAVRAFEAYVTAPGQRRVPIFSTTAIADGLMSERAIRVWADTPGSMSIFAPCDAKVDIHDISGRKVRTVNVTAGETVRVTDLTAGVYIAARTKIAIVR